MHRCERCGRHYYYDSCPYCQLTSDKSGKKTPAQSGSGYFWIIILLIGIIAVIMNPASVLPLAGMVGLVWAVSRLGARGFGKKRRIK